MVFQGFRSVTLDRGMSASRSAGTRRFDWEKARDYPIPGETKRAPLNARLMARTRSLQRRSLRTYAKHPVSLAA